MSQIISFVDYAPPARFDGIAWTQVEIEEGASSLGPWSVIDTQNLSPVDSDPTKPQVRNITTNKASSTPNLWYRLIFLDGSGNTSQPSQPILNGLGVAFATPEELANRLGLTFSSADETRATALLSIVSGMIQEESKQKIVLVTDDVWNTPGTPDEMVKLPEHPVVSVSSVTLDGQPLVEGSDWYLKDDAIRRIPAVTQVLTGGLIDEAFTFPLGTGFGWPAQTLSITYTHGFDSNTIPQTVKAICLEAVIRAWVNPGSVARERVGDTQTVYDNMRFSPSGLLLTDDEKKTIRRVFGRTAKSIQMGL